MTENHFRSAVVCIGTVADLGGGGEPAPTHPSLATN